MASKTAKKAPAVTKRPAKGKAAVKAQPAAAVPAAKGGARPWMLMIYALIGIGLGVQGYLLFKANAKRSITINFLNPVAPNGRDADNAFCCARAMNVDHAGDFYVLEEPSVGHRLHKFSAEGVFKAVYNPAPKKPEQVLDEGYALASDSEDNLYVLEKLSGKIKVLTKDLKYKATLTTGVVNTTGIAISKDDKIFICDMSKGEVVVLNRDGQETARFNGGKTRMTAPYRLSIGPDGLLYVLDFARGIGGDPDVKVYSQAGEPQRSWTLSNFPVNIYVGISVHPKGYVLVNDNRGNSLAKGIQFYNLKGKLVGACTNTNNGWNFQNTSGFTLDQKRGDIYVNTNFISRGGDRFGWDPDAPAAK